MYSTDMKKYYVKKDCLKCKIVIKYEYEYE